MNGPGYYIDVMLSDKTRAYFGLVIDLETGEPMYTSRGYGSEQAARADASCWVHERIGQPTEV